MDNVYTAALIGLGNIAWRLEKGADATTARTHLGAYQRSGRVTVVCGYSPVARDRDEFEQDCGVRACARLEEIWDAQPDIVSICSPSEVHYDHALECLSRKVPMVWLEKPPTLKLNQLDTLIHQAAHERQTSSS